MTELKKLPAVFFATPRRREPVKEWLKSLDAESRRIVGKDIVMLESGWPVGMPVCKDMGRGLHEVRSNITTKRIARVLFSPIGGEMVLLHGFIKKAQKTPKPELDLALKRMKEYTS